MRDYRTLQTHGKTKNASDQAFALLSLANQLARAANGFRLLAGLLFRGLFIEFAAFHFAERALALHLFLKRLQGLLDIIVADVDLDQGPQPPLEIKTPRKTRREK